ncbi:MAG: protein-tyrosine phosphatase [Cyclobacteriaceae bacterium]|jgi:protein-tyrosine phosphatase
MFGWSFSGNKLDLSVDIHSHLIPNVDDGSKSVEETVNILQNFEELGIKKVITTPHIYADVYPNTEEFLTERYEALLPFLKEAGISIDLRLGAEYFCDENFLKKIKSKKKLLSFGDNYVLVETSFYTKPIMFQEVFFELQSQGYKPILAHPERYQYLEDSLEWLESIVENGVILQVNWGSLIGAYGKLPRKIAQKLLKKGLVTFMGSDLHRENQLEGFKKALDTKIQTETIQNDQLI